MRTNTSFPAAPSRTVFTGQAARFALASIRMVNGGLALTAPGVITGRFDEPTSDSAAAYAYGCSASRLSSWAPTSQCSREAPPAPPRASGHPWNRYSDTGFARRQQAREAAYRDPADLHDTPPGRAGTVYGVPGREIIRRKSAANPYPLHVYRK